MPKIGFCFFTINSKKINSCYFFYKKNPSFVVKYRGREDVIAGRAIDRATDQIRNVEVESSHIRVKLVVPTASRWKRLAKQNQFHAPRITRRR